ncbi:hypothetical protein [Aliivibrio sifiae]|uniref:Uncharacterized protein n=1 Tax=Aliivibrio sifiae TaxID=566293 RepID=A0A2S7X6M0_9GAMM|nr:hypothetical protein [Aliivibrio sifiae]PQJ86802.1 hypothetical protein BTO23_11740 [Aliivibrio sifiae]GLR74083.1 hypothetical protein GCM10007855_09570 [Aliivibrio sifiae]
MPNNTFRFAMHYFAIQHQIFHNCEDISRLYEKYGESVTECLFLSHLIEKLEFASCGDSLLTIVSKLIEFELMHFQPPELMPLYDYNGQRYFKGEIVYLSDNAFVSKITSNQFPTWELLLTVVARATYSVLPNVQRQIHFEFSVVTL